MLMIATAMKLCISVPDTFLPRTMPPEEGEGRCHQHHGGGDQDERRVSGVDGGSRILCGHGIRQEQPGRPSKAKRFIRLLRPKWAAMEM